jgi:hypothetical protein
MQFFTKNICGTRCWFLHTVGKKPWKNIEKGLVHMLAAF